MLPQTAFRFLLLAAAAVSVTAQAPGAGGERAKPGEFVLEAGGIEIATLIDRSAEFLGWNIMSNAQELANMCIGGPQYQLQKDITTDREGCEDLLSTMLSTKGFVVRPLDEGKRLYEVVALYGPRARDVTTGAPQRSPAEILLRPKLRMPVTTVVHLQHVSAQVAIGGLRPFFDSGGPQRGLTLGAAGSGSSIVITGIQDQVAAAIQMLAKSDIPENKRDPGLEEQLRALQKRVAVLEEEIARLRK